MATADHETVLLPKVMELLLYLCRHSQQVVTFDELNTAIWPREVVGDNAIYNLIGQLRKVLGDSASKPIYIQTISKVGYRLIIVASPVAPRPVKGHEAQSSLNASSNDPVRSRLLVVLVLMLIGVTIIFVSSNQTDQTKVNEQTEHLLHHESLRQLKLARYQLYRGDDQGVNQAIETLQKLVFVEPQHHIPKIELAYAFIRKARIDPGNKTFWLEKAQLISRDGKLGMSGRRLAAIIKANDDSQHVRVPEELFSQENVLISARLAYNDWLFQRGKTAQALVQIQLALNNCLDCPYLYRQLATAQIVMGDVQKAFDSFSHYRMLINRTGDNPIDNAGYVPLTLQNLKEMASWHFQSPLPTDLLAHQRNSLALFYLSLGLTEQADAMLVSTSEDSNRFFDLYTHAAIAGARGEFEKSLVLLQKRQSLFPDNDRFKLSVVYALWQLGRDEEAIRAFKEFAIVEKTSSLPEVMPFPVWSIYAALLINTNDRDFGNEILAVLETQLRAGLLSGSHTADIRLASILALQGHQQEALDQLESAISQGWVSDFNQNWWYLQDSPYFKSLTSIERFNKITTVYHERIATEVASAKSLRPELNSN